MQPRVAGMLPRVSRKTSSACVTAVEQGAEAHQPVDSLFPLTQIPLIAFIKGFWLTANEMEGKSFVAFRPATLTCGSPFSIEVCCDQDKYQPYIGRLAYLESYYRKSFGIYKGAQGAIERVYKGRC